jgi:PilZ domain
MQGEQRIHSRAHVLRRGKIVFRRGYGVIDCVLLDVSPSGARLRVGTWLGLPDDFELRIENGSTHRARVRYRNLGEIGVQFVDELAA